MYGGCVGQWICKLNSVLRSKRMNIKKKIYPENPQVFRRLVGGMRMVLKWG